MNVILKNPILVSVSSAKLVIEDGGRGTVEFTILDQPVRLNIESSNYNYDINIVEGDKVRLIEPYGVFDVNSKGVVQKIIPNETEDRVKVLFYEVYPDQVLESVSISVDLTKPLILFEVPLRFVEKI